MTQILAVGVFMFFCSLISCDMIGCISSVAVFTKVSGVECLTVIFTYKKYTKDEIMGVQFKRFNKKTLTNVSGIAHDLHKIHGVGVCIGVIDLKTAGIKEDAFNKVCVRFKMNSSHNMHADVSFEVRIGIVNVGFNPEYSGAIMKDYDSKTRILTIHADDSDPRTGGILTSMALEEIKQGVLYEACFNVKSEGTHKFQMKFKKVHARSKTFILVFLHDGNIFTVEHVASFLDQYSFIINLVMLILIALFGILCCRLN